MSETEYGPATTAIHVGQEPDPITGAVLPSPVLATTFVMDEPGIPRAGYDYSRSGNPTRDLFGQTLAALEHGERGFALPSGLAAEDLLLRVLTRPGDSAVFSADVYGGTFRLFTQVFAAEGRTARPVGAGLAQIKEALEEIRPAVLWLETPSNPQLDIIDIAQAAQAAHQVGALLVVDNTFASPALQQPLTLGADVVVHSTTKSIGGHSDLVGGAIVTAAHARLPKGRTGVSGSKSIAEEVAYWQNATGCVASPQDAWLASRGLKTLAVRVQQANASALKIAQALKELPGVKQVIYPGLPEHRGHETAKKQMSGFGAVVAFRVDSPKAARAICKRTKLFALAVSLGSVESLIEQPASMTHATKADDETAIPEDLIRLAVGLEDVEDLIADLKQAIG
ncbi:MAG: PLP-dependent transferase [Propionibacteriaceae bacterium]|jgi:cystathionine gamma-synthase|nr:PLP-dependent transferase [Propionibacteriaceae bacterium]